MGWEKTTNSTRATVHAESLGDIEIAAVSPRQNSGLEPINRGIGYLGQPPPGNLISQLPPPYWRLTTRPTLFLRKRRIRGISFNGTSMDRLKQQSQGLRRYLDIYSDFISKNAGAVSQIESALRTLTYIVPGKHALLTSAARWPNGKLMQHQ